MAAHKAKSRTKLEEQRSHQSSDIDAGALQQISSKLRKQRLDGAQLECASKASTAGRQTTPRACLTRGLRSCRWQDSACHKPSSARLGACSNSVRLKLQRPGMPRSPIQDPCSTKAKTVPVGCCKQQDLPPAANETSALRGTRPFPCSSSGQLHIHTLHG